MPSGKSNTSGSLNGGVVNQPRSFSQIDRRVEAFLDRGPDGEGRGEVVAGHLEVGAVPHAELVDLAEQLVGGVPGEHVGQAGLDAHADQRQLARLLPLVGQGELVVAQLDPGLAVRRVRVRVGQRHRHVEVVGAGPQRGVEQRHHEPRVGGVHQHVAAVLGEQGRGGGLVPGVELDGAVTVLRGGRVLGPGQVVVGDDQVGKGAAGRDPGEGRTHPASPDKKDAHACDPSLLGAGTTRDQS